MRERSASFERGQYFAVKKGSDGGYGNEGRPLWQEVL
jgi:hypothetical protein